MSTTPGPWRVWGEVAPEVFPVAGGARIALCSSADDARLIAAAPELLAALQKLDAERGHTFHKPAGAKGYEAVVIPRELFDSIVTAAIAKAAGGAA